MNKAKNAETAFRQGLQSALSVRGCTNNEIFYVESSEWTLEIKIRKQQIKFWSAIQQTLSANPSHNISKLVAIGSASNNIKC